MLHLPELHDDLHHVDLIPNIHYRYDHHRVEQTVYDLWRLMKWTSHIGESETGRSTMFTPSTAYGKIINEAIIEGSITNQSLRYSGQSNLIPRNLRCEDSPCRDTEPTLIRSLSATVVKNSKSASPVIITKNDEPVGIIKSIGKPIGLWISKKPHGTIFPGMYFITDPVIRPKYVHQKQTSHIPVQEIERILPIQFSVFLISTEDKISLQDGDSDFGDVIRQNDITTLHSKATKYLEKALPMQKAMIR